MSTSKQALLLGTAALLALAAACGHGDDPRPEQPATGGASGTGGSAGSGGTRGGRGGVGGTSSAASGGAAGSAAAGSGAGGGPGGSGMAGTGTAGSGMGGSSPADVSAAMDTTIEGDVSSGVSDTSSETGPATPSGSLGWYEAEAVPPNQMGGSTKTGTCSAGPCPSAAAIKEGLECCSGGKKAANILGRTNSWLQINGVSAPGDGMYDVTWWFHCGKNDNFGDKDCGGRPHTPAGCRPHQIIVNGKEMAGTYHFPCFSGSWGEIHASTVTVPLKAGATNTIRVYVKAPRDAADMDAIQIFPAGQGLAPNISSTPR